MPSNRNQPKSNENNQLLSLIPWSIIIVLILFVNITNSQNNYYNEVHDYGLIVPDKWIPVPQEVLSYATSNFEGGFFLESGKEAIGLIKTPYFLHMYFNRPELQNYSLEEIGRQLSRGMQREFSKVTYQYLGVSGFTEDQMLIDQNRKTIFFYFTVSSYPQNLRVAQAYFRSHNGLLSIACYAYQHEFELYHDTFNSIFRSAQVDIDYNSEENVRLRQEEFEKRQAEIERLQREADIEFERMQVLVKERRRKNIIIYSILAVFTILGTVLVVRRNRRRKSIKSDKIRLDKSFKETAQTSAASSEVAKITRPPTTQPQYTSLGNLIKELGIKPSQKNTTATFVKTIGLVSVLVVIIYSAIEPFISASRHYREGDPYVRSFISFIVVSGILWLAYKVYFHGRVLEQTVKTSEKLNDTRKPLLYLRSFKDDNPGYTLKKYLKGIVIPYYFNKVLFPPEEALMKALDPIGPLIAIGQPGEQNPDIGADRFYSDPEGLKWQKDVSRMLEVANVVILRAGTTWGLKWEFHKTFKEVDPENILIYVDLKKRKYNSFIKNFHEWTKIDLPDSKNFKFKRPFFIYFDENKGTTIKRIRSPFLRRRTYQADTSPFLYALRPVYERLKVVWREPHINRQSVIVVALLVILGVLIFFIVFLMYGIGAL